MCPSGQKASLLSVIELRELSKRYGPKQAVAELTATVPSGRVTAFLGPNGAGKSTTMRMIVGLARPTEGSALIDGRKYRDLPDPVRLVGAHLDAGTFHPRRSGRANLLALARYNGLTRSRVDAVIEAVGISAVAAKPAGTYSLGMAQRLGIAGVMLGDPATVILDEPANGLDADGVRWIRALVRKWAAEGRTVLISSHLMSEVALIADRVLVLGRGRLLADKTLDEFTADHEPFVEVAVRNPEERARLRDALPESVVKTADRLRVHGLDAGTVGQRAYDAGIVLRELTTAQVSLEEAYLRLVTDEVEYAAAVTA
jgi:ABC-2 type transport system ATP-binding protein